MFRSVPYNASSSKAPSRWNYSGQNPSVAMQHQFSAFQPTQFSQPMFNQQQFPQPLLNQQQFPQSFFVPPAVAMPPRLTTPTYAALPYDPLKKAGGSGGPIICHKCKQPGHMQKDCPQG